MAKTTLPEGCVRVTYNVPKHILDKVKERANIEGWNTTTAVIEALKEFTKDY